MDDKVGLFPNVETEEERWKYDSMAYLSTVIDLWLGGLCKFEMVWPLVLEWARVNGKDHVLARDALQVVEGLWLRGPGRRLPMNRNGGKN